MQQTHLFCFLASYSVAFLFELVRLWKTEVWLRWVSLGFTLAGLLAQIWYLLGRSQASQLPPLVSSTHDWLLVSALLVVGAYFIYTSLDYRREGYTSLGLFVLPLCLLMIGAASLVKNSPAELMETERFWTMIHASSLAIGITGVVIGFLLSLMYLLQHRRLKQKHVQRRIALPPLSALASYNRWAIILSMPMLTLGLVTGFVLGLLKRNEQTPVTWSDPLIIGFCILWVGMLGMFVWLIRTRPTHGRQVAILTAWSCGFLLVTIFGLQVLINVMDLPSQHGSRDVSGPELQLLVDQGEVEFEL